jgi:peptide/nickel transport system substrate-binding protein
LGETFGCRSPSSLPQHSSFLAAEIPQKAKRWSSYNDALSALAAVEQREENRQRLFIRMNDMVVDQVAAIPLLHRTGVSARPATLEGVVLSPWESNLWLLKDWRRADQ